MGIQTYRDLEVWQKGMNLVVDIYRLTKLFPKDEQFGLVSQTRRAVVSVPANIAEGHGRLHRGDYLRFLSIARGSLVETETHLIIAHRLEYVKSNDVRATWGLLQETGRLLNGLIRSLEKNPSSKSQISETAEQYDAETDPRSPIPDPWAEEDQLG